MKGELLKGRWGPKKSSCGVSVELKSGSVKLTFVGSPGKSNGSTRSDDVPMDKGKSYFLKSKSPLELPEKFSSNKDPDPTGDCILIENKFNLPLPKLSGPAGGAEQEFCVDSESAGGVKV